MPDVSSNRTTVHRDRLLPAWGPVADCADPRSSTVASRSCFHLGCPSPSRVYLLGRPLWRGAITCLSVECWKLASRRTSSYPLARPAVWDATVSTWRFRIGDQASSLQRLLGPQRTVVVTDISANDQCLRLTVSKRPARLSVNPRGIKSDAEPDSMTCRGRWSRRSASQGPFTPSDHPGTFWIS